MSYISGVIVKMVSTVNHESLSNLANPDSLTMQHAIESAIDTAKAQGTDVTLSMLKKGLPTQLQQDINGLTNIVNEINKIKKAKENTQLVKTESDAGTVNPAHISAALSSYMDVLSGFNAGDPATAMAIPGMSLSMLQGLLGAIWSKTPDGSFTAAFEHLMAGFDGAELLEGDPDGPFANAPIPLSASGMQGLLDALAPLIGGGAGWGDLSGRSSGGWLQGIFGALGNASSLPRDPLVVDLDGDGIELTTKSKGTWFDLDGDQFAEQTGWVSKDDGLLTIDRNGNGRIDDIGELFGDNATANGFSALSAFDANHDGKIDAKDTEFDQIKVWQDNNQNGVSEASELHGLTDVGITSISLASIASIQAINGNNISDVGTFGRTDGTTGTIAEVWFDRDVMNSIYAGSYTPNIETLFLPKLRGYGQVADLNIAMSLDPILLEMVKTLTESTLGEGDTFDAQIEALLYHWAGVQDVDPLSRGLYIDARHLAFLEKYLGTPFVQASVGTSEVRWNAGVVVEQQWDKAFSELKARLLVQGPLVSLFPDVQYNLTLDQLAGTLSGAAINAIADAAPDPSDQATLTQYWAALVPTLDELKIYLTTDASYESELASAITASGLALTPAEVRLAGFFPITGTSGDDVLLGTSGANLLDGGAGNDLLKGAGDSDGYVFDRGYGQDTIDETDTSIIGVAHRTFGAHDIVLFGTGIKPNDLTLSRGGSNHDDLIINLKDSLDQLTIKGFFTSSGLIEELRFSNGVLLSYSEIMATLLASTPGDDVLVGDGDANRLDGGAGNDDLQGRGGDDTYVFGRGYGEDHVLDGGGADSVEFKSDIATGDVTLSRNGSDLVLGVAGTPDRLTIANFFTSSVFQIEQIKFSDATVWTATDIVARFIDGTGGNDTLVGTAAADYLNGAAGADSMTGKAGNDTYVVDNAGDTVVELTGEGYDTVESSISYNLGSDIEALTLTGSASTGTGNNLDNRIIGNTAANTLNGADGNDVLDGGSGADTLIGGKGNDAYYVDNAGDTVTENASEGTDTIFSTLSIQLASFSGVENVTLFGATDVNATGVAGANALTGNNGSNVLDGGAGADTLSGGLGNDTYVVDDAGDAVTEAADAGLDTVQSGITYTLGANVENLQLTGAAAIDGTGNSLGNTLTGNGAANKLTGAAGNDTLDGGLGIDTLIGGTGDDTYVVDNAGDVVTEAASEGNDTVQSSIAYTLGSDLENLTLTGSGSINGTGNALANVITGNSGVNTLTGGDGNDTLDGGAGADSLVGGKNDDTYVVDASDTVTENVSEGTDTIVAAFNYTLGANLENLTLTGSSNLTGAGNTLDNKITGNAGNNDLSGGDGNDTLNGGIGADKLTGGKGNDTYVIDDAGDTIVEVAAEGTDTVVSSIGYTLAAELENLTLTGALSINGTGNAVVNILVGNGENNILDGAGGADQMSGGTGDDTYIVDNASDVATEQANEGNDTVKSSVTYTIVGGVDNLTLTGASVINGTGNTLDNVIIGNSAVNTLTGGAGNDVLDGGAANDSLVGNAGDDTYIIDNVNDKVTEAASEGTDTVQSSVTYTLATNVENLVLTGSANINGTGNTSVNVITGNAGDNVLSGGTGADTLIGGAGNDTYVVDVAGDVVLETNSNGTDLVQSSIAYTLNANVENLTLTSTGAIAGTGNALDNVITGNTGANTLTGGAGNDTLDGGTGNDTLVGGVGDDTYVIDVATDIITELTGQGNDTVKSAVAFTLVADLENLTLTGSTAIDGTGNAGDNVITGNSGVNTLTGGDGNDTLNGGLGADTLIGGKGDDTYVFNTATDTITEVAGEGIDQVLTDVTYTLATEVENLTLTGTGNINGTGNTSDNLIIGNIGNNALSGANGNDTLIGGAGNDALTGGAGWDTASYAASNAGVTVSLAVGVMGKGGDAEGDTLATVEYLIGSKFDDNLTGDTLANRLDGGAGNDTLTGGTGNDTYIVDTAVLGDDGTGRIVVKSGDTIVEAASAGTDAVESTVSYSLSDNLENLTLIGDGDIDGYGNASANIIVAGTGDNKLYGGAGNDTLDAGEGDNVLDGGAGNDSMKGGSGSDTYYVDSVGDFTEDRDTSATAIDYVISSAASYTLGNTNANFVENLTLVGSAVTGNGNWLNNILIGNALDNVMAAYTGDDTIEGGAGADTLDGGTGNDTVSYAGSSAGVTVDLSNNANNQGGDAGTVAAHDILSNFDHIIGSAFGDSLTGTSSANTINGGTGNDVLIGQAGNDTYIVDAANLTIDGSGNLVISGGDQVTEKAAEGTDIVLSSVSYAMGPNVEQLTLTGTGDINGAGDVDANTIIGNAGSNRLYGGAGNDTIDGGDGNDFLDGGTGNDALEGGLGSDTYYVDAAGDTTEERDLGVIDYVVSSAASYTLGNTVANYVENLTLVGSAVTGIGNWLDNTIIGNALNNTLDGQNGNDILEGGAGADALVGSGGTNAASYAHAAAAVVVNMTNMVSNTGDAAGDTFTAIQNLIGSAFNDTLTGDTGVNLLDGGDGDDTLSAGTGADTLAGGKGNDVMDGGDGADIYLVDDIGADKIADTGATGVDVIKTTVDFDMGAKNGGGQALVTGIESLILLGTANLAGTGNDDINTITGNSGSNKIAGGAGNDIIDGGDGDDYLDGGTGNDALKGGLGSDTYYVDSATDTTEERDTGVTDYVVASVTYTLGNTIANYVEYLTLVGSAVNGTGNWLDNTITGNAGANILDGGNGNDILRGGLGNDTLIGNGNSDTAIYDYVVGGGVIADLTTLKVNAGAGDVDTLQTIEHLTGSAGNDSLSGDANANTLTGADGDDILSGVAGADMLLGGNGNDTLIGGAGADVLYGGAGIDTAVFGGTVAVNVDLSKGTGLLGDAAGDTLFGIENLTGTNFNDTLTGDTYDNRLDGGTGNDTMKGGAGNDTYIVDTALDSVTELANEGVDTVETTLTYSLGSNIENLTLKGATAINGTGNELGNSILGNSGANTLSGGAGNDVLEGGAGADIMVGGSGDDTYKVGLGSGADSVNAFDTDNGVDTLAIGAGASYDQLWFARSGNDLNISIDGTTDVVTVQGWYSAAENKVDRILLANGDYASSAEVEALCQAMASFNPPPLGQMNLDQATQQSLQPVLATNWHQAA